MSNKNSQFKDLLDFLISVRNNYDPWIFRKEIAAWAAVVLYFPILFAFYNFVKAETDGCLLIIIAVFIAIICALFLLFLFKQYDSIFNLKAERVVFNFWIFRLIDAHYIPEDFDLTISGSNVMPNAIIGRTESEKKKIRKSRHIVIFLVSWVVAFKLLFGESHQYNNMEIQESIIYNLVVFFTLLLLFYIVLRIDFDLCYVLLFMICL